MSSSGCAIARDTVQREPRDWDRNPSNPRRSNWLTDPVSGPLHKRLRDLAAVKTATSN